MSNEEIGEHLNPFEHAYTRPDAYIGSVTTETENEVWRMDENKKAIYEAIPFNRGLFNVVREIGSNATDNKWRSEKAGVSMRRIEFKVNEETGEISIYNDGYWIPAVKKEWKYKDHITGELTYSKRYPAEVYFGDFFTSTNYKDDEVRKTSGRNGMGAKAANVFSTEFNIEHSDPTNKKLYNQKFEKNGTKRSKPVLASYPNKTGYTDIRFTPDYAYFKYPNEENPGIDKNFVDVLRLYAYEVAMVTGITTVFNGEKIVMPSLDKYSKIFYPTSQSVHLKSSNGDECVIIARTIDEDMLSDSLDVMHTSFVNGIQTYDGGVHVNKWRDAIFTKLLSAYNERRGAGAAKGLKASKKELFPYFHMIIRCELDKPKFKDQTKNYLTEPKNYEIFDKKSKKEWDILVDNAVKKMMKWDFVDDMTDKLVSKASRTRTKTTTKKQSFGPKIDDAYMAGKKGAEQERVLFITEGDSAKTFVVAMIACLEGGSNYYGVMPVRGKSLNVEKASIVKLNKNVEIANLRAVLGLVDNRNYDYTLEENKKVLRYDRVCIMSDADDDGIHIRGLLINILYRLAPKLLLCDPPFVTSQSTKVIQYKLRSGSSKQFYSMDEARKWLESNENIRKKIVGKPDYYKGLGTMSNQDAVECADNQKILSYHIDEDSHEYMDIAFSDKIDSKAKRKDQIVKTKTKGNMLGDVDESESEIHNIESVPYQYEGDISLSTFVRSQLILFQHTTILRAIPSIFDGLKRSQRQVLYGIRYKGYKDEAKVVSVSGAVMELTHYAHGDMSLTETIVKLAQGFVGSNNIPLLVKGGIFGSRLVGGKDHASARYLKTNIESIVSKIFRVEDEPLLTHRIEENDEVEYEYYMPIIPMILVNGVDGIATGMSSSIPCHNPLDIVKWIEAWLEDEGSVDNLKPIVPWYQGFKGNIYIEDEVKGKGAHKRRWVSEGILEQCNTRDLKGWWRISEIPVGLWIEKAKEKIEEMLEGTKDKTKQITDYREKKTTNTVEFLIKPTKNFTPDMSVKGNLDFLITRNPLSNMIAIDENYYPHKFDTAEDILKFFCPRRLLFYGKRKEYMLELLKFEFKKASNKYRFVKAIVDKELDMYMKGEELEALLESEEWNFEKLMSGKSDTPSFDYLLSMHLRSMTVEKLAELKKDMNKYKTALQELKNKTKRDLWREDLEEFKVAYPEFVKYRKTIDDVKPPKKRVNKKK